MSTTGYTQSEKIAQDLAKQIESGTLEAGQRLASELQLAQKYGTSRGTIRRALAILQRSQMLTTKAGSGSYVAFHGKSLAGSQGWTSATATAGMPTTTTIQSIDLIDTPAEVKNFCTQEQVYKITRTRHLKNEIISLEISIIPANERVQTIMEYGLLGGSISATLRATGMKTTHGFQDISIKQLSQAHAQMLQCEPCTMILAQRTGLDNDDNLCEYVESWLSPEHFTLHLSFEE